MTDAEIELLKLQINIQMAEYEQAMKDALVWHREWKAKQTMRGFRCVQKNSETSA